MIFMDVELNDITGFEDFHINFSYPRKLNDSNIPNEFLKKFSNFRYKKLNIIMGANASGKTSFGNVLKNFVSFLKSKQIELLTKMVKTDSVEGSMKIDFVDDSNKFYRFHLYYDKGYKYDLYSLKINKNDSYETCCKRISKKIIRGEKANINEVDNENNNKVNEGVLYTKILEVVLKSLDDAILKVEKINNSIEDHNFIVYHKNFTTFIENKEVVANSKLSTGTKQGIKIANFIYDMLVDRYSFYYCDELFTFTNSEFEKACLSFMVSLLDEDKQLFFTTHNSDILDIDLPLHSYVFFRKKIEDNNIKNSTVFADSYSNKNTCSLRNAVENDVFDLTHQIETLDCLYDHIKE